MSKTIDSLTQASLDSGNFPGVILAKLYFDPEQRYSNAYQSIYWDEGEPYPNDGEQEYVGLGNLASMSILTETSELAAQTIQLTLSGIPNSMVTDIFSNDYIGKPVYVWYATLNKDTYAVEDGPTGPVLVFAGRMDFGTITFGQTATITVNATSRLADWERPRGGRFNHAYQTRHVDPTDDGFKNVQALQNKPISWGGSNLDDPGSIRIYEGCFEAGTLFRMENGSVKKIEEIKPGDIMEQGDRVYMTMIGDGLNEQWYNAGGIHVTGGHVIKKDDRWMRVKDAGFDMIEPREIYYTVNNYNHRMVHENGQVFTDFNEIDKEITNINTWIVDKLNNE